MIKISDLRNRDVVNILDGKKLGNIIDIDLDLDNGRVLALVLPGRVKGFLFTKREEVVVPWQKNRADRTRCYTGGSTDSERDG